MRLAHYLSRENQDLYWEHEHHKGLTRKFENKCSECFKKMKYLREKFDRLNSVNKETEQRLDYMAERSLHPEDNYWN